MASRGITVGVAAAVGLGSLAAAMGIGRFAFTPIFPLMQEANGVTLSEGAWLATANYLGYLVGAVVSFVLAPKGGQAARWGLLAVAVSTLAMGFAGSSFAAWMLLRLAAGVASAFVLIGASTWTLAHLSSHRRSDLAGWVFAGVGIGICLAGALALVAAESRAAPEQAWVALGAIAAAITGAAWTRLAVPPVEPPVHESAVAPPLDRAAWLLVVCYGAFGFGYIVPATFIPASARSLLNDPIVFGWAWPLFGIAAAISTVMVTTLFRSSAPRRIAVWSLLVMAAGVAAPAIRLSLAALVLSAVCVGGTFMVMTMAAVQEARRIARGTPTRLIAALTAAFALGQLAGPLMVSLTVSTGDAFAVPSAAAVALLVCSSLALWITEKGKSRVDVSGSPAAALARGHDRHAASRGE